MNQADTAESFDSLGAQGPQASRESSSLTDRQGTMTAVTLPFSIFGQEIRQSDVAARDIRPADPARGCLLPSVVSTFHHR